MEVRKKKFINDWLMTIVKRKKKIFGAVGQQNVMEVCWNGEKGSKGGKGEFSRIFYFRYIRNIDRMK